VEERLTDRVAQRGDLGTTGAQRGVVDLVFSNRDLGTFITEADAN
jgi:hypothetical protein